jgi:hypothetical protein
MKLFFIRAFRAAKLDAAVFDEVMENSKLMIQAIIVVFIYAAAVAYGTFSRAGATGINGAIIITLIGWYIWAFSTYFAGVRLFPETGTIADRKAFMRTMGFASSPGWLRLLGLVPEMGGAVFAVISIWMVVAAVVAVKKALNYTSTQRAAAITVICWILSTLFQGLLYIFFFSVFGISNSHI